MVSEMKQALLCPACGCEIVNGGFEKEGAKYCCGACATGTTSACQCGCCRSESEK